MATASPEPTWTADPLSPDDVGAHQQASLASGNSLRSREPSSPPPLTRVQSGAVADHKYIPTPSLDPKNIELLEGVDKDNIGYIREAINAFGSIYGGLQRLSDAREKLRGDTSRTEANKVLLLAAEAEKLQGAVLRSLDTAHKNLTSASKATDEMLSGPLTEKAASPVNAEIRSHFKSLSDTKRSAALSEAVQAKDLVTLTAVLAAPAYLSGLSSAAQREATRQFRELTQPDIAKRLKVQRAALDLIEKRGGLVITEVEKALNCRWDVVQKLRKTSNASEAALLLINNPVQP